MAVLVGRDLWSLQACCKTKVAVLPALALGRCSFVYLRLKSPKGQRPHIDVESLGGSVYLFTEHKAQAQGLQLLVAEA